MFPSTSESLKGTLTLLNDAARLDHGETLSGNHSIYSSKEMQHDDVITQLEPDILECEVKWALRSITMNKASGDDGMPAE